MSYSVTKNASFLTGASIIQKAISFVYFSLVARFLGVEQTGAYFFAITFTTIFSVLADAGLGPVLTREVAKDPKRMYELVPTVLRTKIILGIATYGCVFLAVNILNYSPLVRNLVYVSGITMVFDNLQTVFYSILRAHKNLFYEAMGVIGTQLLTLVIGTLALINHWPLVWLILAYAIPSFCNLFYVAAIVHKRFRIAFFQEFNQSVFKLLIKLAWPFAVASFIGRLYSYTDTVLISKLLSPQNLGWWGLANKIVTAFQFVPIALTASVYPSMSTWFVSDVKKVAELFEKSWRYLFFILLPIVAGIIVLAPPIIAAVYGPDFLPSVPVLRVLLAGILFAFLSLVTGATLNATGNQLTQTALLGGSLVFNIVLNIVLIPRFGIIGAAGAELVSNAGLWLVGLYLVKKKINISLSTIGRYFNQLFWPAVIMGMVVYWLSSRINFYFTIPVGALVYCILIFCTGAVKTRDLKEQWAKIV